MRAVAGMWTGAGCDRAEEKYDAGHRSEQPPESDQLDPGLRRARMPVGVCSMHQHERGPEQQHRQQEVRHHPWRREFEEHRQAADHRLADEACNE